MFHPIIEMVGHHIKYVPEIVYTYIDKKDTSDSIKYSHLLQKYEPEILGKPEY